MKTNPNDPMIPVQEQDGINHQIWHTTAGLTKREYFSSQAMISMSVNGVMMESGTKYYDPQSIAKMAVEYADALIIELNKEA